LDVVEAYRNVIPEDAADRARELFGEGRHPDWITFTSSSTVENILAIAGREALQGVKIASIGPVTSQTLRAHGLAVDVEAKQFDGDGLIAAILEHARAATR
jgi:uroporphyrinogen III methyltransferase/synthase